MADYEVSFESSDDFIDSIIDGNNEDGEGSAKDGTDNEHNP